ncbi:unnamed protein product, partial [Ectocarpus sp. 12 AP-2014]
TTQLSPTFPQDPCLKHPRSPKSFFSHVSKAKFAHRPTPWACRAITLVDDLYSETDPHAHTHEGISRLTPQEIDEHFRRQEISLEPFVRCSNANRTVGPGGGADGCSRLCRAIRSALTRGDRPSEGSTSYLQTGHTERTA